MSRQGYLILHDKRQAPRIVYFSLEDGTLRYFQSAACRASLGEVRLSGCKLVVKAQRRADGIPHAFFVEARKVFVKDRAYTLGAPVRLELSAHSSDERQEWGKALFSWQRQYWREPRAADETMDVLLAREDRIKQQLEQILQCHLAPESSSSRSATPSFSFAVAKQPLTFLRRNASSLRRSFSMYMPTSTSTAATCSSSTDSSTTSSSSSGSTVAVAAAFKLGTSKPSTSTSAVANDCAKDKVVLAKVAYAPPETIYRSTQQVGTQAC
ncbi:hypothetical protein P43SY_000907 [Pythium insidiosum]|uniref:PH domain-containing protein n=1 Tax=Pythium insidiosum TaxID=114742 RepID=A0AAD5QAD6_PYTIN|nr:hypothetical protein P43SY_000907 [Pythium insidiosum]